MLLMKLGYRLDARKVVGIRENTKCMLDGNIKRTKVVFGMSNLDTIVEPHMFDKRLLRGTKDIAYHKGISHFEFLRSVRKGLVRGYLYYPITDLTLIGVLVVQRNIVTDEVISSSLNYYVLDSMNSPDNKNKDVKNVVICRHVNLLSPSKRDMICNNLLKTDLIRSIEGRI